MNVGILTTNDVTDNPEQRLLVETMPVDSTPHAAEGFHGWRMARIEKVTLAYRKAAQLAPRDEAAEAHPKEPDHAMGATQGDLQA